MKKFIVPLCAFLCIGILMAEEKVTIFKSDASVIQFDAPSIDSIKLENNKQTLVIYENNQTTYSVPVSEIDSITMPRVSVSQGLAVRTTTVSNVGPNAAKIGMEIDTDGSSVIREKGICWNTQSNPTTGNQKKIVPSGTATWCIDLTGLNSNTTYFARAYVTTSANETRYGNEMVFTTENTLPIILTVSAEYQRREKSVICTGNIVDQGNTPVLERGFCWSVTNRNPTVNDSKIIHPQSSEGTYSLTKENLNYDSDYYMRAYATNASGTSYGKVYRVIPVTGNVRYHFFGGANPDYMGEYKFNLLKEALDSACYYMNKYTGYVADIPVDYHPGVPTAEAGQWWQMKWGDNERYMYVGTAMHEMCHYFGSGQDWRWFEQQNSGFGGMTHTNALVNQLTGGVVPRLYAGGGHFWPFGCNQREEVWQGIDGRFANEEYLTIMAKLIWEMRLDCGWWTGE